MCPIWSFDSFKVSYEYPTPTGSHEQGRTTVPNKDERSPQAVTVHAALTNLSAQCFVDSGPVGCHLHEKENHVIRPNPLSDLFGDSVRWY